MARLSRRAVTTYIAERLSAGDKKVIPSLAAYLIDTKQTAQLEIYVRDIQALMAARGYVVADVTAAFSLAESTKLEINRFIKSQTGATKVELRQHVDETVLGGVKLQIPGRELDATIARHLTVLRTRFKKA